MKNTTLLFLLISLSHVFCSHEVFFRSYGTNDGASGGNYGTEIADGGIIAAGQFDVSTMVIDALLVKYDRNGLVEWGLHVGDPSVIDDFDSMSLTQDDGYICCGVHTKSGIPLTEILVAKFFSNGTVEWVTTIGGSSYDYCLSIIQSNDGTQYFATGKTRTGSTGLDDSYLASFDLFGTLNWVRTIGGSGNLEEGTGVFETIDNDIVVVGKHTPFVVPSISRLNILITKFYSNGQLSWARSIGDSSIHQYPRSTVLTLDGGFIMCGYEEDYKSFIIVRTNHLGEVIWSKRLGGLVGGRYDECFAITLVSNNQFIVGGKSQSIYLMTPSYYPVLAKFDIIGGNLIWVKTMSQSLVLLGYINDLKFTSDGGILSTGGIKMVGDGYSKMFVSKTDVELSSNSGCGNIWITVTENFELNNVSMISENFTANITVNLVTGDFNQVDVSSTFIPNYIPKNSSSDICSTCYDEYFREDCLCSETKVNSSMKNYPCTKYGRGNCSTIGKCECFNEYFGDFCELWKCGDFIHNETAKVCNNGKGSCDSVDNCTCFNPEVYHGNNCQFFECFNISNVKSEVCGGHGTCIDVDNCLCHDNYYSTEIEKYGFCGLYFCNGLKPDDKKGCSGHGICEGYNECKCEKNYLEMFCDDWECFGTKQSNNKGVCNGNGKCIEPNVCDCGNSYGGDNCDISFVLIGVLVPIGTFTFLVFSVFVICILCCVCLFVLCCFCVCCCIGMVMSMIALFNRLKVRRFRRLKNFDILMKEQMLEEDTSIAHLKITKSMFIINFEEIKVLTILGEGGSNSVVYKANWNGNVCAFKCFKTRLVCESQNSFDEFEKEVNLLSSLSHMHIIQFFGSTLKPPRVGILMEFCENGEIQIFVEKYREKNEGIEYPQKIRLCTEIASALLYLHNRNVIHRDLKCENVLIDSKESCKVMDFGLSRTVSGNGKKTRRIGTSVYMAPEIVVSEYYTEKCDVFSFGILLWIVLTENSHPYGSTEHNIELKVSWDPNFRPSLLELQDSISKPRKNMDVKKVLMFVASCWAHDADQRPDFKEICEVLRNIHSEGEIEERDDVIVKKDVIIDFGEERKGGNIKREEEEEEENGLLKKVERQETLISELMKDMEILRKENEELRMKVAGDMKRKKPSKRPPPPPPTKRRNKK